MSDFNWSYPIAFSKFVRGDTVRVIENEHALSGLPVTIVEITHVRRTNLWFYTVGRPFEPTYFIEEKFLTKYEETK